MPDKKQARQEDVDFGYLFANCLQRPAFRSTDKGEPKPAGRTHSREAISLAVSEKHIAAGSRLHNYKEVREYLQKDHPDSRSHGGLG
jgi:hypothetical protein